jgi:CRP/FNR family transcriptional regulator, cyclic AMP receptor protein
MALDLKKMGRFAQEMVRDFEDGEAVFIEGDENRDLFVIQSGAVRIKKKTSMGELELAEFQKGEFFGDMALLQGIPRFASAYAVGKTRLLVLHPGGFLLKIRRDPTFAFEMLQQLSLRVKVSSDRALAMAKKANLSPTEIQEILKEIEKAAR